LRFWYTRLVEPATASSLLLLSSSGLPSYSA